MGAYSSFRFRDYRLLLAGVFFSNLGLQMTSVAASWDLYIQTRSAMVLGNVGLVQVAPFVLLSLWAGHVADRFDRRRVMTISQAVYLISCLVLALSPHSVFWIYGCLLVTATARTFQGPARGAVLPQVVPPESLSSAITWMSSAQEIANVGGPAVAGLLLALTSTRYVYMVQVVCAIVTLICFASLRVRRVETAANAPSRRSFLEGLHFVRDNKLILSAVSLDLFGVLFGGATALLPIFAVDILHAGPAALGWLRAAPSLGAVLMAVSQAHYGTIVHAGPALLAAVVGFGLATIGFAFSHSLWLSLLMLLLTGVFDNVSVVLRNSLVHTRTPDYLKGRVLAVNNIFVSCSNQLGAMESGWTAHWLGAVPSVWVGGLATILIAAGCAVLSPQLRRWRQTS
ncbi:MAG: major facilitator superfamily 1 [Bryobacterales bacterium]|nr:major facilitator superfamily 1 [Bryobacterales bacterium]